MTPEELNQACVAQLQSLDLSEYVVFVGSGPSSPYIAPSVTVQDHLCSRCKITKDGTRPIWKLAQKAYEADEKEYYAAIRESYDRPSYWQSRTYTHIA